MPVLPQRPNGIARSAVLVDVVIALSALRGRAGRLGEHGEGALLDLGLGAAVAALEDGGDILAHVESRGGG